MSTTSLSSSSANNNSSSGIKRIHEDEDITNTSSIKKMSLDVTEPHADTSIAVTTLKSSSANQATAAAAAAAKEEFIGRIEKRFAEIQQTRAAITTNIVPLSDELSIEKIASIKAKKKAQQRKQVSSGVGDLIDEELVASSQPSSQQAPPLDAHEAQRRHHHHHQQANRGIVTIDYANLGVSESALASDESQAVMRELALRECVNRSRTSVLQSTGKQFEKDITAFLQLMKAREDGAVGGVGVGVTGATTISAPIGGMMTQQDNGVGAGGVGLSQSAALLAQKSRQGLLFFFLSG